MSTFRFSVNGTSIETDAAPDTPILWVLRDHLNLVGTKFGCGAAHCGACTVHLEGRPVRSCVTPVSAVGDREIRTIEAMSADPVGEKLQKAWSDLDVAQCGYCQPGQIMSASALLKSNPKPTDDDIDAAMNGNICRCYTYNRIREAIKRAAG